MLHQIKGLHHVTSMASHAETTNRFFRKTLALRRVKKTVNFDAPDTYHLYYADEFGTPGSVITYFPFSHIARRHRGAGEAATVAFSIPEGAMGFWEKRLAVAGVAGLRRETPFDEPRLAFTGPDDEDLALVEQGGDEREPWTGAGVSPEHAIRGFHSVALQLADGPATEALLGFMGYREIGRAEGVTRLALPQGNGAGIIDIRSRPDAPPARLGAGSIHHVAFSVENRAAQLEVRKALTEAGHAITPVIDRDYFWAMYFRSPGGVLFEVATNEPGFTRDEAPAHLGEALKLPSQHAHLRDALERSLPALED